MTTEQPAASEIFAIDFATLAREIAMDIFPVEDILALHKLEDSEWQQIQDNPRFQAMLSDMVRDWAAAGNTKDRVRIKAATGLESTLEIYIRDIADASIPLNQRVEAGKFLARLGELDGAKDVLGATGGSSITINISSGTDRPMLTLTGTPVLELEPNEELDDVEPRQARSR